MVRVPCSSVLTGVGLGGWALRADDLAVSYAKLAQYLAAEKGYTGKQNTHVDARIEVAF